jgi:TRAP-type uncharacterized transport system fused permease subunit
LAGAMMGIASLGVAFSGYLLTPLRRWERWWIAAVSMLFIAPGLKTMAVAVILMAPVLYLQFARRRSETALV